MTSEVCLMNRLAVVLAADSATTVTRYGETGKEERYFKGANKIFQLSNFHPVGLMIYDSADILHVPWELVVKEFRSNLEKKSFNSLRGYAEEFFVFLDGNNKLFPVQVQKDEFLNAARSVIARMALKIKDEGKDLEPEELAATADIRFTSRRTEVDSFPLSPCLDQALVDSTISGWSGELAAQLENWREEFVDFMPVDLTAWAELGILEVFKIPEVSFGQTGLVFAGFGDHDIFPAMIEFSSSGIVIGKHVQSEVSKINVDHSKPAGIKAFAQTSMSDTFSLGFSQDVYISIMRSLNKELLPFAKSICESSGISTIDEAQLEELAHEVGQKIGRSVLQSAREEHAMPLRRVLGVLPVDEMAELAETLINLQSLKEKVTKPSETVGGPIDVAIITRNEGLVWIRRKHFFESAINSRYVQRAASIYK